jgi:hypothetical protein
LKIPKGQSEYVYQRTDNTMAKRKSTNILREYIEKELLITDIPFEYDFEVNFSA